MQNIFVRNTKLLEEIVLRYLDRISNKKNLHIIIRVMYGKSYIRMTVFMVFFCVEDDTLRIHVHIGWLYLLCFSF